jgi:hypothetical protein
MHRKWECLPFFHHCAVSCLPWRVPWVIAGPEHDWRMSTTGELDMQGCV